MRVGGGSHVYALITLLYLGPSTFSTLRGVSRPALLAPPPERGSACVVLAHLAHPYVGALCTLICMPFLISTEGPFPLILPAPRMQMGA